MILAADVACEPSVTAAMEDCLLAGIPGGQTGRFDNFDEAITEGYLAVGATAILPPDTVEVANNLPIALRLGVARVCLAA
jgi:hypothetical protein